MLENTNTHEPIENKSADSTTAALVCKTTKIERAPTIPKPVNNNTNIYTHPTIKASTRYRQHWCRYWRSFRRYIR